MLIKVVLGLEFGFLLYLLGLVASIRAISSASVRTLLRRYRSSKTSAGISQRESTKSRETADEHTAAPFSPLLPEGPPRRSPRNRVSMGAYVRTWSAEVPPPEARREHANGQPHPSRSVFRFPFSVSAEPPVLLKYREILKTETGNRKLLLSWPWPRDDTRRRQAIAKVWRTTGRGREGPRRGPPHPLTNSKPVEPKIAQNRTHLRGCGESNQ